MRPSILLVAAFACSSAPPPAPRPIEVRPAPARPVAKPGVVMRMGGFPTPPRQFTKATYDAPLPARFLSTVSAMFDLGLADPRGCEYREIEVMTGSIWGGEGVPMKAHGWVLPGRHRGTQWAVTWNGLVYPTISVGAVADMRSDVAALIKRERDAHAKEKARRPDWRYHRFGTTAEGYNLSHESATAVKVALVLQLGDGALAKQLWDVVALDESLSKIEDPFALFAVDWAWNLFERAVVAHMRGDTAVALPSARLLAVATPKIEAEADRRKVERRSGHGGKPAPHVAFVDQLQLLIDDETRREALGARSPLPDAKALAALDPKARAKLLIENLDQVAARQWGQPGGVDLASDPIVTALIEIGAPAVEPLIEVLETDSRLTRSVHFWRDFARSRSLLGVHEAAYVALAGILERPFFDPASTGDNLSARGPDGRRTVADKVRAYWDQWKGVPLEERWMIVLADDQAKPDDWLDAAAKITRPHNVMVRPSSTVFTTTVTNSNGKPGMRGDVLRSRQNPSVGDLMLKRLRDRRMPSEQTCSLVIMFGTWDLAAAKPHLKDKLAKTAAANKGAFSMGRCIVALAKQLFSAGDDSAIDAYATWLAAAGPPNDYLDTSVFELMTEHPTRASVKKAADLLFRDDSPWVPLAGDSRDRLGLLDAQLIRVGGFNRHVVGALTNAKVIGTLTVANENGGYNIKYTNGGSMSTSTSDKDRPAKGTTQTVRISDIYAWHLASHHSAAPRFQLYWPDSQRNDALALVKAWVAKQAAK